jgi:hypothetical protein
LALAVSVTKHWDDGKVLHVLGTITASGSYTTDGDTLSFVKPAIKSASVPLFVNVIGKAGYTYVFVPGTTQANGKLLVFYGDYANSGSGPLIQIPQASYPSGVTGDTIQFNALFMKLQ